MAKFSERLRLLRKQAGLSQQGFANLLGIVSKSSINMYERGEREPSLETLEVFADFFNVDLDYLLGKSDIPNRAKKAMTLDELSDITDAFFERISLVLQYANAERDYIIAICNILGIEAHVPEEITSPSNYTIEYRQEISEAAVSLNKQLERAIKNASTEEKALLDSQILEPIVKFINRTNELNDKLAQMN